MYKCGWNGCEKAYGTLNHLNAHVTMQSHGQKRVPEGESNARRKQQSRLKHITPSPPTIFQFHIAAPSVQPPCSFPVQLTDSLTCRVQGDSQGMEGAQEGRRS